MTLWISNEDEVLCEECLSKVPKNEREAWKFVPAQPEDNARHCWGFGDIPCPRDSTL